MISALRLMLPRCCYQCLAGHGLHVTPCNRDCQVRAREVVTQAGYDYVGNYWLPNLTACGIERVLLGAQLLAPQWFCDLDEYFEPIQLEVEAVDLRLFKRLAQDPEVRRAARTILELATRASEVRPALRGLAGPA